jgi:hypothetical protein
MPETSPPTPLDLSAFDNLDPLPDPSHAITTVQATQPQLVVTAMSGSSCSRALNAWSKLPILTRMISLLPTLPQRTLTSAIPTISWRTVTACWPESPKRPASF